MAEDKQHVTNFHKEAVDQLEKLIDGGKKIIQPEHPSDHKPLMAEGTCQICRWLDPEAKQNKKKGPAGKTMFEAVKAALEDFELALSAVRAMTPGQFHAVAIYIKQAAVSEEELLAMALQLAMLERMHQKMDRMLENTKGPVH